MIAVDNSADKFGAGHVPGARFIRYDQIAVEADGLGAPSCRRSSSSAWYSACGISDKSRVVIYGSPIAAASLFFTLDYLGHPSARLLNGGLNAWKASGGQIERPPAQGGRPLSLTPKPRPAKIVSAPAG